MPNNDQLFNVLVSNRINLDNSSAGVYFQIDKVKSKTNSEIFDASSLLFEDVSSNVFPEKKNGGGFGSRQDRFGDDRITGWAETTRLRSARLKFLSGR